jgi:hypothetical protein
MISTLFLMACSVLIGYWRILLLGFLEQIFGRFIMCWSTQGVGVSESCTFYDIPLNILVCSLTVIIIINAFISLDVII